MDVRKRIQEHYDEAGYYFYDEQIIGIFLQGSQNYGLETPESDVDTKCIITPCFQDIALNRKPKSGTHILDNGEHLDYKDVRLYFETFRKQNLNFLEILFTDYFIINPTYTTLWGDLLNKREEIAHMNPYYAVKAMSGVAYEKYRKLFIRTDINANRFDKYEYDPKQLFHLFRIEEFIEDYISGYPFKECMKPSDPKGLIEVKHGYYHWSEVGEIAAKAIEHVDQMANNFFEKTPNKENKETKAFLDKILYNIMEESVKKELSI